MSAPSEYHLAKGKTKRFPIKFLATADFMKMEPRQIVYQFSYDDKSKTTTREASFFIKRDEQREVLTYALSRNNFIAPQGETTVSMAVENRGYGKRSITITPLSENKNMIVDPQKLNLTLDAREKQHIDLKIRFNDRQFSQPNYTVRVITTDSDNQKKISSTYFRLTGLSRTKQFRPGPGIKPGKNFAAMTYNEQNNGFNYLQLRGNSEFQAKKDLRVRLNGTGNYYLKEHKYNFYDTYLELERKGTKLRLGNIYVNDYDYNVSGRGAKINTPVTPDNTLEIIGAENNYNLFGNYLPEHKNPKMAAAKYTFKEHKTFQGKLSYVFDHDPRLNINTHLAHAYSSFTLDSVHHFEAEAGLSHEKGIITKDNHLGVSAGLNYQANLGGWQFRSHNLWADHYYSGLSRGTFDFNQMVSYQFSNHQRLFARYQNTQVNPKYLPIQTTPDYTAPERYYFFSTQRLQSGFQFLKWGWHFLLSPTIEQQKNKNNLFQNKLNAYRFNTVLRTNFGHHNVNLSAEYSYSNAVFENSWFDSFKGNISYRYKSFSVNGGVQINPHDVIDLNPISKTNMSFVNYNIYGAYNFSLFNNVIDGSVSTGINSSELYQNNNGQLSGTLDYKISQSWSVTAYANYSAYKTSGNYVYQGDNYQFRVGLKKHFIKSTSPGHHKLTVQIYHDRNQNGRLDEMENVLPHKMVYLDDKVAVSDKHGIVKFQNIPKGHYELKVAENGKLRMKTGLEITIDQTKTMELGLIKKAKVIGKLVEIRQKYDDLETDVRGVIVYARDEKGHIYNTVVNRNNEFEFFLMEGTYDIYIKNDKYKYLNPSQKVDIKTSEQPEPMIFKYKKKNRTIKVKKF